MKNRNSACRFTGLTLAFALGIAPGLAIAAQPSTSCTTQFSTLSAPFRGLLKTQGNRYMYHEYTPADSGRPVQIGVHGLGDSMDDLRPLMRAIHREGDGLLMVDQNGHGSTLDGFRGRGVPIPDVLPYTDNVEDMYSVVKGLDLKEVELVGHSMGGGTSHELARKLQQNGVRVRNLTLMAPYVFRLDGFLKRQAVEGALLIEQLEKNFAQAGVKKKEANEILAPLRESLKSATAPWVNWVDYLNNNKPVQELIDKISDPWLDGAIKKSFTHYFEVKEKLQGLQLTEGQLQRIQDQVDAALATTKGLRELNFFRSRLRVPEGHSSKNISWDRR